MNARLDMVTSCCRDDDRSRFEASRQGCSNHFGQRSTAVATTNSAISNCATTSKMWGEIDNERVNAPFTLDRPDVVHVAVCDVLCDVFPTIDRALLLHLSRGNSTCAWVRQLGMYLMHERLGAGLKETARRFERDRATVRHASKLVRETVRKKPTTAAFLAFLEAQVLARLNHLVVYEAEYGELPDA